jgi:hypothetical protein
VLDLDIQVTRGAAGDRSPRKRARDRFLSAYARAMVGAAKITIGAACGVVIAVAIWAIATIIRGEAP